MLQKNNVEIVNKPEYADMVLDYIQFHRTELRKPKQWYPELLYNSKLHQNAKISSQIQNAKMTMSPTSGLLITLTYPLSKENLKIYNSSLQSGKKFKIYIPKNKMIKITFDNNLKEFILANNKQVAYEQYKKTEGYGELHYLDIVEGTLIIKLIVKN